ncbi:MAG: ACT domain-containing protein [Solirubrobacterales bacterium]|nr:ACT domain-containing protein [Solirubrobacterales bacterium]
MNLAVTAIGRDQPGIVAAITGVLLDCGGNVDDSQMSILHGHFAVMLLVSVPDETEVEQLSAKLGEVGRDFGLGGVTVSPVDRLDRGAGPTHVLTVYGPDRPGIVHEVAELIAARGVNVTDLRTRRTGEAGSELYTMMMELAVPDDSVGLDRALAGLAADRGIEVNLAELDAEIL